MYKELLTYIVKGLVSDTTSVKVVEDVKEDRTVYRISASKEEMGRIIGKEGRIIRSIREIMRAYASKNGEKIVVDILDEKE